MNYFITFRCYGTWLHGDERGAVDMEHNQPGEEFLVPDARLKGHRAKLMATPRVELCDEARLVVADAIGNVASHREWNILALNVLQPHVHVVVTVPPDVRPEKVMGDFKAWSTRRLRERKLFTAESTVWSHHGSTRYLNDPQSVHAACLYVTQRQHEPGDDRYEPEG